MAHKIFFLFLSHLLLGEFSLQCRTLRRGSWALTSLKGRCWAPGRWERAEGELRGKSSALREQRSSRKSLTEPFLCEESPQPHLIAQGLKGMWVWSQETPEGLNWDFPITAGWATTICSSLRPLTQTFAFQLIHFYSFPSRIFLHVHRKWKWFPLPFPLSTAWKWWSWVWLCSETNLRLFHGCFGVWVCVCVCPCTFTRVLKISRLFQIQWRGSSHTEIWKLDFIDFIPT